MKKIKKYIIRLSVFFLFILISCDFLDKKEILPNYFLITNEDGHIALSYHQEEDEQNYPYLINDEITEIAYNDKYIIAKQKPSEIVWGGNINTINYYILPIKKGMDWKIKNGMMGPLSLEEFDKKAKELNISLEFKKLN